MQNQEIPQTENGMRSPKNNWGHINNAHSHLLALTPEGIDPADWSRLVMAYQLLRGVREDHDYGPSLMEEWDNRAPRRFRCDSCSAVFLTRSNPEGKEASWTTDNPKHCPFCSYGYPEQVEGYDGE